MAGTSAVLFNGKAGQGQGAAAAAGAVDYMRRFCWRVIGPEPTPAPADERRALITELAQRADLVVVVGGDGTLRETAAVIYGQTLNAIVGLVPIGNANVLARELNIPLNPSKAIRLLTTGYVQNVDAALMTPGDRFLEPQFFMAMLDIGFGAAVIHQVDQWRQRWQLTYRLGSDLLYLLAGIKALRATQQPTFQIRVDDHPPLIRCRLAVIANARTYAKGWSLTPQATPTDGVLNVFGRQREDPAAIAQCYLNAWGRSINRRGDVHYRSGRRLVIAGDQPLCLQVDGEPLAPQQRLRVDVLPSVVRIVTPPHRRNDIKGDRTEPCNPPFPNC
jgi:diacylglycerol kinase family enzyme